MFWQKKSHRVSKEQLEKLKYGYLMAIEEIDALLETLSKQTSPTVGERALSVEDSEVFLQNCRNRISETAQNVSNDGAGFAELADEANALEAKVAKIAEAVWGYDEARVSGLLFAWGVLKTHADEK